MTDEDLHGRRGSDKRAISKALRELEDVAPVTPWTEYDDLSRATQRVYEILAERHPDYDAEELNWTERDQP